MSKGPITITLDRSLAMAYLEIGLENKIGNVANKELLNKIDKANESIIKQLCKKEGEK